MSRNTPTPNTPSDSDSTLPLTYGEWVASARCVIAILRRHIATGAIVCDRCYLALNPRRQNRYERVIRHYIAVGNDPAFESCLYCSHILVGTIAVRNATCGVCPRALTGFLRFIGRRELLPHEDPEATIIVLREFKV